MDTLDIRNRGSSVPPWGWLGSWEEFVGLSMRSFLRSLLRHIQNRWSDKPLSLGQVRSWIREYEIFQPLLKNLISRYPPAKESVICFEYELALEEGERPDVLLHLPNGVTLVSESKNRGFPQGQDFKQVRRYERSLILFHSVQHIHPVLLLLQAARTELNDESAGHMTVCDTSELGIKKLSYLLETEIERKFDTQISTFSPAHCYQPTAQLVASVAKACKDAISTEQISKEQTSQAVVGILSEARERREHVVIALPGEKSSGKTAFGLQVVAEAWEQGISSLYLTGDEPPPHDVDKFYKKIGNLVGWTEASCFIRGMSQFARFATRNPLDSPFHFFVFDNTRHCLFPQPDIFPRHDEALVSHASIQEWSVILLMLDFEGGIFGSKIPLSATLEHWFWILLTNKGSKPWKFFCPQTFGVSPNAAGRHGIKIIFDPRLYLGQRPLPEPPSESDGDPLHEMTQRFISSVSERADERWQQTKQKAWQSFLRETGKSSAKRKFKWSKELLVHRIAASEGALMHGIRGSGVSLIHELAACGRLNEVPPDLLTWDVLTVEGNRPGRTPIRHAAKYGHIEQIPPEAVAGHYDTVSEIALQSVESSQMFARSKRRLETCRWLIKVALARKIESEARASEARGRIEQMVDAAIREGSSIPVPNSDSMTKGDGDLGTAYLEQYLSLGSVSDLESSIFEFYFDRLIALARSECKEIRAEQPTHIPGRSFNKRLVVSKQLRQQPVTPKHIEKPTATQIDLL